MHHKEPPMKNHPTGETHLTVVQHSLTNSIGEVSAILRSVQTDRLFLVVDEPAWQASGAKEALEPQFRQRATTWFTDFELNPKLEDVERGIEAYRECQPDLVIALGGGTAIDLAKLIGSLAVQAASARDIATGRASIESTGKSLMAIPTTAGTGSEATHFAVVYVDGEKYSVAHPSLLPRYAVVDSRLTASLPKRITAATGLDAFCQAIESMWSVAATEESMRYATDAVRLAFGNLVTATNSPTPETREAMSRASHLAGKAINITKTTAPHALSYALTSRHGVPHGMAVAITLTSMLAFNAEVTDEDCNDPRGADAVRDRIARILSGLGTDNIEDASASIKSLLTQINCPTTFDSVGIQTSDELKYIVDSVNAERLSNNPRRASQSQLFHLLQTIQRNTVTK
jgi:alcohol dehydrogenase class IV